MSCSFRAHPAPAAPARGAVPGQEGGAGWPQSSLPTTVTQGLRAAGPGGFEGHSNPARRSGPAAGAGAAPPALRARCQWRGPGSGALTDTASAAPLIPSSPPRLPRPAAPGSPQAGQETAVAPEEGPA